MSIEVGKNMLTVLKDIINTLEIFSKQKEMLYQDEVK